MQTRIPTQPIIAGNGPDDGHTAESWADSSVLYLLTCYDVWSATPSRGCEPAPAKQPEDMCVAA